MKITSEYRTNLIICLLSNSSFQNGRFSIFHKEDQRELVEYKRKLLKPFIVSNKVITKDIKGKKNIGFLIKKSKFTRSLKRWLFPQKIKTLTPKTLKKVKPTHLAIWWMDNGKIFYKKNDQGNITSLKYLLSMKLTKENNQILIDWFKSKHDISFYQVKHKGQHCLCCGTREGEKLMELLKPYIL